MASYFGPTNLPPLEAWAVGTPVIYPEAFKAQAGDAAILFDYDSPSSLADAIVKACSAQERVRLAAAGKQRLVDFAQQTEEGHHQFARHLLTAKISALPADLLRPRDLIRTDRTLARDRRRKSVAHTSKQ